VAGNAQDLALTPLPLRQECHERHIQVLGSPLLSKVVLGSCLSCQLRGVRCSSQKDFLTLFALTQDRVEAKILVIWVPASDVEGQVVA
jgi:hypothetical protein